jgi:hypothetical protein
VTKRPGSSGWQNKNNYLVRLRRVEGQIRGLQRMVEDDKASFVPSQPRPSSPARSSGCYRTPPVTGTPPTTRSAC